MMAQIYRQFERPRGPLCQIASNRGSDAISMVSLHIHGAPINRACRRSILARPYIWRLTSLSLLIWPSV